jgi:hypothetical protein
MCGCFIKKSHAYIKPSFLSRFSQKISTVSFSETLTAVYSFTTWYFKVHFNSIFISIYMSPKSSVLKIFKRNFCMDFSFPYILCRLSLLAVSNYHIYIFSNTSSCSYDHSPVLSTPRLGSVSVTGWCYTRRPKHCVNFWSIVRPHMIVVIADSSTRDLWQWPRETSGSEAGDIWREMPLNFAYEVFIFVSVGIFNMP